MTQTATEYLNVYHYTDVESYKVISASSTKATVIEVKKVPTEKWNGTNLYEMYRNAEIVEVGEPFEIVKHRGNWGRWASDTRFIPAAKKGTTVEDWTSELARMTTESVNEELENVWITFLTKTGKDKKIFVKMNNHFDDECRYFYDHSF